jgi:hypothetical protein
MTIDQANTRVFAELLKRELAGKPSVIRQIDIEREGGETVAWCYLDSADEDDCFCVSFTPRLPMPPDEIRRLLTRDPLMVR